MHEGLLREAFLHVEVKLDHRIGMELGCRSDDAAKRFPLLLLYEVPTQAHDLDQRIQLPTSIRREPLHSHANPAAQFLFEVCLGDQQKVQQVFSHLLDVFLINEHVCHVKGALPDRDVKVLQAIDNRGPVPLDCLHVHADDTLQRCQSHITCVVVATEQEAAQNVDTEHAEPTFGLDGHDCQNALVQDRVAGVFSSFSVGGDLRQDVIHLVARFHGLRAK
mmetsp:Transcript_57721/g.160893  ORF Transcript_57721/g.160893 Transcript_57721/m.160893 type:complete len:220 (-) Transcript_57721:839-1498(-)